MKNEKDYLDKHFFDKVNKSDYVGVEIEMPIVNLTYPHKVDMKIIQKLFLFFLSDDFETSSYDNENNIIAIKNTKNGDTISLEYSVNTLEFSLNKELSIYRLKDKFFNYYDKTNTFLKIYNYKLHDGGINPYYRKIDRECLNQNRYRAIERLLNNKYNKLLSQFCAYCCSIQTHVNVSVDNLVNVMNMFTRIEDKKSKIFGNSYMDEVNLKNSRSYIWGKCNFGPLNNGKNRIYKDLNDLKNDYLNRNLFYVERNGKYLLFNEKQKLSKYLDNKEIDATDEKLKPVKVKPNINDLDNFRSYKSVELTRYGTLEIRTDCTQKINNIFKVVAFNVGVSKKSSEILKYLREHKSISNKKLFEYAIKGLKERNKDEEELMEV